MASKSELYIEYAEHEYKAARGLLGLSLGPMVFILYQMQNISDYGDSIIAVLIGLSFVAFLVSTLVGARVLLGMSDAISQMKRTLADNPQEPSSDVTFSDVKRHWRWSEEDGRRLVGVQFWSLVSSYALAAGSVAGIFIGEIFEVVG